MPTIALESPRERLCHAVMPLLGMAVPLISMAQGLHGIVFDRAFKISPQPVAFKALPVLCPSPGRLQTLPLQL